jgi:hypothetical protein
MVSIDPDQYHKKAKELVADSFNKKYDKVDDRGALPRDFYVTWFAKVLGNWKAMVSTDIISGQYWEVTYDGNKKQTYVDHYEKRSNECVTDDAYASLP